MNFSNITWLDDKGHIKPPIFLYLMLIFLARGWCVFIASLTQFNDRTGLVRLFYPEKSDFLLALASGVGAVIIYGLVIAERKRSPQVLRPLFNQIKYILWLLLIVDALLLSQRLVHDHFVFKVSFALDALFIFWSAIYLLKSKRLQHYFKDWQNEADYMAVEAELAMAKEQQDAQLYEPDEQSQAAQHTQKIVESAKHNRGVSNKVIATEITDSIKVNK